MEKPTTNKKDAARKNFMHKRTGMVLIYALCLIALFHYAHLANAVMDPGLSYNISYECTDGRCVEGQPITWKILFYNAGMRPVEYTDFELIDAMNETSVAEHHISYWPLRNFRGDILVSYPKRKAYINFSGIVPIANTAQGTRYYPCFSNTIEDIHVFVRRQDYTFRQCYSQNFTLPSLQCTQDAHCKSNQYCSNENTCLPLTCGDCQYISNHTCSNHQCCASNQCAYNQRCENNTCIALNCQENQFIHNNTCQNLICNFDESITNGACIKLECSKQEYMFNHSCKILACSDQEYTFNHTCRTCAQNQRVQDNECVPLKCKPLEGYSNHACVALNCKFFEDIKDHTCKTNYGIIFKLSAEGLILIIAAVLLFLDIRKFRMRKRAQSNQSVSIFSKSASLRTSNALGKTDTVPKANETARKGAP